MWRGRGGLAGGRKLGLEDPCHLRGPVQLIETQFPRFAGILCIRRRRHGDGAQTPSKRGSAESGLRRGWGEGDAVGAAPLQTPPPDPGRAPRGPSPGSGLRAALLRDSPRGPRGSAALVRSVRSCHSRCNPCCRHRRRHGPGAEARRHFRPPCIPPRDGDVTALTRHARRGTGLPLPRGARAEPARWTPVHAESPRAELPSVALVPNFSQAGPGNPGKPAAAAPLLRGARPEVPGLRRGPGCPGEPSRAPPGLSPSRFWGGGSGRPDATLGQSQRLENCVWTIRSRGPGRGEKRTGGTGDGDATRKRGHQIDGAGPWGESGNTRVNVWRGKVGRAIPGLGVKEADEEEREGRKEQGHTG